MSVASRSRHCRLVLAALLAWAPAPSGAAEAASRFLFSGNGRIDLHHAHFEERLAVEYRDRDGRYDPAVLDEIARFMRSRQDGRVGDVSLRLVELIDFVEDRFRPERLVLVSAYRSPAFNDDLRNAGRSVATSSLHTEGMAADLELTGLDLSTLWRDLRRLETGGVGLYQGEGFLHLDTGTPRFWEAATSGVSKNLSKGNARLFARTDFDRYRTLDGAIVRLHSLTAFPLRVASTAKMGEAELEIQAVDPRTELVDGCYLIGAPASRYEFRIQSARTVESRLPLELTTCAPRIEETPHRILTNPIEPLTPQASDSMKD